MKKNLQNNVFDSPHQPIPPVDCLTTKTTTTRSTIQRQRAQASHILLVKSLLYRRNQAQQHLERLKSHNVSNPISHLFPENLKPELEEILTHVANVFGRGKRRFSGNNDDFTPSDVLVRRRAPVLISRHFEYSSKSLAVERRKIQTMKWKRMRDETPTLSKRARRVKRGIATFNPSHVETSAKRQRLVKELSQGPLFDRHWELSVPQSKAIPSIYYHPPSPSRIVVEQKISRNPSQGLGQKLKSGFNMGALKTLINSKSQQQTQSSPLNLVVLTAEPISLITTEEEEP